MSKAQFIRAAEKVKADTEGEIAIAAARAAQAELERAKKVIKAGKILRDALNEKIIALQVFDEALGMLAKMKSANKKVFSITRLGSPGAQENGIVVEQPTHRVKIYHHQSGGTLELEAIAQGKFRFAYHEAPSLSCTQREAFEKIALFVQKYEPERFSALVASTKKKPVAPVRKPKR